jgi:hypothetical protein
MDLEGQVSQHFSIISTTIKNKLDNLSSKQQRCYIHCDMRDVSVSVTLMRVLRHRP